MDRATYYSSRRVLRQYHEGGFDKTRTDFVTSDGLMPMTNGWIKYRRFKPDAVAVFVEDMEGRGHWITETQARVMNLAIAMIDGEFLTMRAMAARLNVAPSTVSRALTRLAAWGLLAYIVGRGRWAGLVIIKRAKGDGLDRFRQAAKARVKRWYEGAQRRLSRLAVNVAPYITEEGVRVLGDTRSTTSNKGATLTAQRKWTPEELRSVGIL